MSNGQIFVLDPPLKMTDLAIKFERGYCAKLFKNESQRRYLRKIGDEGGSMRLNVLSSCL